MQVGKMLLGAGFWVVSSFTAANAATIIEPAAIEPAAIEPAAESSDLAQFNSVSQLSDVKPGDWAFQALQSLVERYGCIAGYPDRTYRGDRGLSRFEFAAGLNACMDRINELIASSSQTFASKADVETLQKLQSDFASELAMLKGRVESAETKVATLEKQQFSTTTKLTGQAIMALNAGGFTGDRIIAPLGVTISTQQPQATAIYRTSLDFNSSFNGKDLLKIRLVTGSRDARDNASGFLEPNLGSTLDFSIPGRNDRFSLARFYYTFKPSPDLDFKIH
jgi:hypothetical protein